MKKLRNPFVLGLIALSALSSCDKDDEKTNKTDLLTAKAWHVTKIEATYGGATEDVTEDFSEGECANDDTSVFHKDGKYEEKIGTTPCYTGDENTTGTWAWKDSETKITITIDGDINDATLVTLSSSTLKVKITDEDLPDAELVFTFTAQ